MFRICVYGSYHIHNGRNLCISLGKALFCNTSDDVKSTSQFHELFVKPWKYQQFHSQKGVQITKKTKKTKKTKTAEPLQLVPGSQPVIPSVSVSWSASHLSNQPQTASQSSGCLSIHLAHSGCFPIHSAPSGCFLFHLAPSGCS